MSVRFLRMTQEAVPIKTRGMQLMERQLGEPIEVYLRRRYIEEGSTTEEVGTELGLNAATVSRWLAQLGIQARLPGQRVA